VELPHCTAWHGTRHSAGSRIPGPPQICPTTPGCATCASSVCHCWECHEPSWHLLTLNTCLLSQAQQQAAWQQQWKPIGLSSQSRRDREPLALPRHGACENPDVRPQGRCRCAGALVQPRQHHGRRPREVVPPAPRPVTGSWSSYSPAVCTSPRVSFSIRAARSVHPCMRQPVGDHVIHNRQAGPRQ